MMREPEGLEFLPSRPLPKATEQRRFHNRRLVIVDMDEKYHERLAELREASKKLNKLLQERFDRLNLPFSTRHEHSKIARLTIQIRPQFLQSTASKEEKAKSRHQEGPDALTIFLHLDDENNLELVRYYSHDDSLGQPVAMVINENGRNNPRKLQKIDVNNLEPIADFIATQLASTKQTKCFQRASELKTLEEARDYFTVEGGYLYMLKPFTYANVIRAALRSLLDEKIFQLAQQAQNFQPTELQDLLWDFLTDFLGQPVNYFDFNDITGKTVKHTAEDILKMSYDSDVSPNKNKLIDDYLTGLIRDAVVQYRKLKKRLPN